MRRLTITVLAVAGIITIFLASITWQRQPRTNQRSENPSPNAGQPGIDNDLSTSTGQPASPPPGLDIPRMQFPEGNLYTEDQVVAYVKSRFADNGASWLSHKATRTRLVNINQMMGHYGDQDLRQMPPAEATQSSIPHWIVYFKSSRIVPNSELFALMGMGTSYEQRPKDPNLTNGSTELYVILDTAGNIDGVGALDPPNELGTPIPDYTFWNPNDLDSLPTIIVPTLAP